MLSPNSFHFEYEYYPLHYLYGSKKDIDRRLVGTFDSEQQLLAYVHWATLKNLGGSRGKFEQGSALSSYESWELSEDPSTDEDPEEVIHNPIPSML